MACTGALTWHTLQPQWRQARAGSRQASPVSARTDCYQTQIAAAPTACKKGRRGVLAWQAVGLQLGL